MIRAAILSLFAIIVAAGVSATEVESTRLFTRGAWTVDVSYDDRNGALWCDAGTENSTGQLFKLIMYSSGQFSIFIFDANWALAKRGVEFRLDIDYKRWTISGSAEDTFVSVTPEDPQDGINFLKDVMAGTAVALYSDSGARLGTFSLRGSSAAVRELMSCWRRIENQGGFTAASDPFGNTSDPF